MILKFWVFTITFADMGTTAARPNKGKHNSNAKRFNFFIFERVV